MNNVVLEARHINKYFHDPVYARVLHDITFTISKGEFVSVIGKSRLWKIDAAVHTFHNGHGF